MPCIGGCSGNPDDYKPQVEPEPGEPETMLRDQLASDIGDSRPVAEDDDDGVWHH